MLVREYDCLIDFRWRILCRREEGEAIVVSLPREDFARRIAATRDELFVLAASGRVYRASLVSRDPAARQRVSLEVVSRKLVPVPLVDIAPGFSHVCGVDRTGVVRCTGSNSLGQVGVGRTLERADKWLEVPLAEMATEVVADGNFSCVQTERGSVFCWGSFGMARHQYPVAVDIPAVSAIVAGPRAGCGISEADRTVWCWEEERSVEEERSDVRESLASGGWHGRWRPPATVRQFRRSEPASDRNDVTEARHGA